MNASQTELHPPAEAKPVAPGECSWSRARWAWLIALVFATHLAFIVAFGDRKAVVPRPPAPAPLLSLAASGDEWIALNDPTLFALPHRQSVAGAAWLKIPFVPFQPFRWSEPPRLLPLPVSELGATFTRFMQTNARAVFAFETKPPPELTRLVASESDPVPARRSTFRVTGGLANRRLLNPPGLPSWAVPDSGPEFLLTNSVVQILVNADGNVISVAMLNGSGLPAADQQALKLAKAARFVPRRDGGADVTLGALVFEWQTVPPPETNGPPAKP